MLVLPIYNKWLTQPTITAVEASDYDVWNVYFPAVSICNNNKISTDRMEEFLDSKVLNDTHYYR